MILIFVIIVLYLTKLANAYFMKHMQYASVLHGYFMKKLIFELIGASSAI